jgi:hypothetical protein
MKKLLQQFLLLKMLQLKKSQLTKMDSLPDIGFSTKQPPKMVTPQMESSQVLKNHQKLSISLTIKIS